jgi:hypothetical protein
VDVSDAFLQQIDLNGANLLRANFRSPTYKMLICSKRISARLVLPFICGAFSWRLHEDLDRLNTYRLEMMVPSWTEYLLEQERLTKSEQETIQKAWCQYVGENPPLERHFLCVNRELHTRHHQIARLSSMAETPLNIDSIAPSATT